MLRALADGADGAGGAAGSAVTGAGVLGVMGSGALLIALVGVEGAEDPVAGELLASVWMSPPPPHAVKTANDNRTIGGLHNTSNRRSGCRRCKVARSDVKEGLNLCMLTC